MSVRSLIGIGICVLVSLLGSQVALAQVAPPTPAPTVQERLEALEKKSDASSLWKTLGFKASGFLDAAYTQNFNNPNTNLNQLHIFDTNANSFMPHLVQLMFERPADGGGSELDRLGFRARLNFGMDARVTRARTNFAPGTSNNELDFQEVYGEYIVPVGNGLKIQAGKINTLIGYEVINSFENPNFSRSFMFGLGQAFTTTGVRMTYTFNPIVTASIGVINGWDNVVDNNRGKSFEWLVALTPHEKIGVSFYGSYGAEQSNGQGAAPFTTQADPTAKRTVVGSIISLKPTDKDTIILEPYYANEGNASTVSRSQNARWNGFAGYLIHDFSDQWSARFRGEIFEDAGGARTCTGGISFAGGTNTCASGSSPIGSSVAGAGGIAQTLWENTFTLQYKPFPSLITRTEFRYDKSDKNVFLYGSRPANNQETLSFQVIYMF
ncbi:MAG: outer membrane beta-barrel protein [Nitrospirota bacterium]|nr:outer membrane beta-barrel protein [Nitrospirota bacterium]